MKRLVQSLFILLFVTTTVMAQERTITGTVISTEDGLPLPGVSVSVKGTTSGTQTNVNGQYSIKTSVSNPVLVFSFIGTKTQELAVPSSNVLNVSLAADAEQLSEVVVTALGISREAKSLGYSATTLKSDDLDRARETNVLNSLAGKAAGVRVNNQSGTIGGSTKVTIRGVNSLGGTFPLYVIDGLTVTESTATGGTSANNVDFGNRLGDISPDDIETMTVLKGSAATALYGARAKDGAIIITTKRGKKGSPAQITVNSSVRFDSPLVLPDFQNEYAQGNQGVFQITQTNGWGPRIANVKGQTFPNFLGDNVELQAYPDNVKDYFQTGVSGMNNVSIAGGGDNSDYRISFSSANEKGIIPESKLNRYTLSVNAGKDFNDKLSSRFTGSYTSINADGRPAQSSNNTNALVSTIFGLPRTVDINLLKNNFEDPETGEQIFLSPNRNGNNPYWIMNYNKNSNTVDRFIGTYTLTYKPAKWISISNNFGSDIYAEKRSLLVRKGTAGILQGKFINYDLLNKQINNDLIATFDRDDLIEDFKFKLIVGGNINQRFYQSTNVEAVNLAVDQLYNYTNAASKDPTLDYNKRRMLGVYGDLGISYKDFLYLDITGRNDWTSTLPIENRSYFYPSVSGSLIFSELLKEKNMDWLSFGKIRASWASLGSDLPAYQLAYQYNPTSTVFLQYVNANAIVFPAGPITTAFTAPKTFPNDQLKPQRQNSFEFGADLRFLNSRIGLDFSYYNNRTKDQLIPITVSAATGYFSKYVNAGEVQNTGIEIALNLVPVKTKDFSWDIDFNFADNNQKVLSLAEGVPQYSLASGYNGLDIKAAPGESFGLYGSKWQRDPDGNIIIDPVSGLKKTQTAQRLGSIYADWTMGINNSFSYKNFNLSALLDIRKGGVFYSGTVASLRSSGLAAETGGDRAPIVIDGVVESNGTYIPNTKSIPAQNYWAAEGNSTNTEANVFDAGFVKLREVLLSYRVPSTVFKKSFVKGLEFGLEGRNLWLIKSHVPHVDPELNFFGSGTAGEGVEFFSIPTTRTVGFNLRLTL